MSQWPVTIRTASDADARLLAEIGARTFADTFGADNTPQDMASYLASAFGPTIQAAELADPDATFLIAEVNGEPAGYAHLRMRDAPSCIVAEKPIELVRMYAERQFHGGGVGLALMRECLETAQRRGATAVWLGVWEHNTRAQRFYRRWEFAEVGTHTFRLGDDVQTDLLMARPL